MGVIVNGWHPITAGCSSYHCYLIMLNAINQLTRRQRAMMMMMIDDGATHRAIPIQSQRISDY